MNNIITKLFLAVELILFLLLVFALSVWNNVVTNNNNTNNTHLSMLDEPGEVVWITACPNSDWSELPLSQQFKRKFNPKKGILNDESIKKVVYDITVNKEEQIVVLTVIDNLKEDEFYVHYILNNKNELDDIEIVKHKLSYDENGKEVIYKRTMNEINYILNLESLADPSRHWEDIFQYINVTDNYKKKHSSGFVSSRGFYYYSIQGIEEICDFENKIVYLKCEYPVVDENGWAIEPVDEGLTLYYRIHYTTNEKRWLDDIEVEIVSDEEINRLLSEKDKGKDS